MAALTFQGNTINTVGELPAVGSIAPSFSLTNRKLQDVGLEAFTGKRKVLNIVPSLDTPTCQTSARKFNEKAAHLDNTEVLVISADLPFAQARFCEIEGIKHLTALSTFRSSFGTDYGINLADSLLAGLTARAVLVLDEHNTVLHSQLVTEITEEPDYASALACL
jgi:thiol peroxidase